MKVMRTFKGSFVNGHLHIRLAVLRLGFLLAVGLTTKISESIMTTLCSENLKSCRISIKNIKTMFIWFYVLNLNMGTSCV